MSRREYGYEPRHEGDRRELTRADRVALWIFFAAMVTMILALGWALL